MSATNPKNESLNVDLEGSPAVGGPIITLNRIGKIATYEVQEMELEQLDTIVAAENQAFGFFTFATGSLISTVIGWSTASNLSAKATAVYFAATVIALIAAVWFGMTWLRAKKERPKLLSKIREPNRLASNVNLKS